MKKVTVWSKIKRVLIDTFVIITFPISIPVIAYVNHRRRVEFNIRKEEILNANM